MQCLTATFTSSVYFGSTYIISGCGPSSVGVVQVQWVWSSFRVRVRVYLPNCDMVKVHCCVASNGITGLNELSTMVALVKYRTFNLWIISICDDLQIKAFTK